MPFANDSLSPFFLPSGLDIGTLPPQLGAALVEIVTPFYERYVVRGDSPMEVATGTTATFLLAQEIIFQYELGQQFFDNQGCTDASMRRQEKLDMLLRLLGAKMRCLNLLHRLAEFYQRSDTVLDV
jgi:hypothetical protein